MKTIKSEGFLLRPYEESDKDGLFEYINQKHIAKNTVINLPWKIEDAIWWISFIKNAEKNNPKTEIHFAIEVDGKYAGSIGIINIVGHRGELGYWIAKEYEGRGIITRAIELVSKYAFKELSLARLTAPVLVFNKASVRVLEKNGFEFEGTNKSFYKKKGEFLDANIYAKIRR